MELINFKRVYQSILEEEHEFSINPRIGDIRYCKRDKCIVIEGDGRGYDIHMSRLKTPKDALEWICHLHQKNWFTPQMHSDFIEMITRLTEINGYCTKWSVK